VAVVLDPQLQIFILFLFIFPLEKHHSPVMLEHIATVQRHDLKVCYRA